MNLIQWFVRLLKKDMTEYEVKAEEKKRIYSAVETKLKNENIITERGGKK